MISRMIPGYGRAYFYFIKKAQKVTLNRQAYHESADYSPIKTGDVIVRRLPIGLKSLQPLAEKIALEDGILI